MENIVLIRRLSWLLGCLLSTSFTVDMRPSIYRLASLFCGIPGYFIRELTVQLHVIIVTEVENMSFFRVLVSTLELCDDVVVKLTVMHSLRIASDHYEFHHLDFLPYTQVDIAWTC